MITESEWEAERQWLSEVVTYIRERMEQVGLTKVNRKEETIEIRKNFWDEIRMDASEIYETAASIQQQSMILQEQERSYSVAYQTGKQLLRMLDSPYFGRLDFKEAGYSASESIYIGFHSLLNEDTQDYYVFDWRSPIASMFYDYSPGPVQYQAPAATIQGEMTQKRQYVIRDGRLKHLFDTGVHIGDSMLQQLLGENHADGQMHNIVSTIQKEQNRIIRDDRLPLLIVQGAAGSGKTSAALQRVAYLLYKHRERLGPDHIVLFSPNPLFYNYISNVLPELGESNLRQTTFFDYLKQQLGKRYTIEDLYEQTEYALARSNDPDYEMRMASIYFKSSVAFLHMMDRYVELLEEEGILFRDLKFRGRTLISAETMSEMFYDRFNDMRMRYRLEKLQQWLLQELKSLEREERKKAWVRQEIEYTDPSPTYKDMDREIKQMRIRIVRKYFKPLRRRVKRMWFYDVEGLYLKLFHDSPVARKLQSEFDLPQDWRDIAGLTTRTVWEGQILYEDALPLLYLRKRLEGFDTFNEVKYLVIDEAQDYTPFQYEFFKELFPRSRVTLLGDWNQGIYRQYEHTDQQDIFDILGEGETYRLSKSYRSTKNIVEFTRAFLNNPSDVEAFEREGEFPKVIYSETEEERKRQIAKDIEQLIAGESRTTAVICRTAAECGEAYQYLLEHTEMTIHLITRKTNQYEQGICIIPSYLSKGLEFDDVIIYHAGSKVYEREDERNLFYTICTRALHRLHLHYTGSLTPFVASIDPALYSAEQNTLT